MFDFEKNYFWFFEPLRLLLHQIILEKNLGNYILGIFRTWSFSFAILILQYLQVCIFYLLFWETCFFCLFWAFSLMSYLQNLKYLFKGAPSGLSLRQFFATESSLKMMKNASHFTLKALFALMVFKFFVFSFWSYRKTAWLER